MTDIKPEIDGSSNIQELVSGLRSEELSSLRGIFGKGSPFLLSIEPIVQINLILDANVVISQILWEVKKKKAEARPELYEIIICKTVTAYAPCFLIEEIEKNLPKVSSKKKIPLERLMAIWEEYKPHINFVDVESPSPEEIASAKDPKDLPYLKLQNKLGAAIYSRDPHIPAMKGRIITFHVIASLKDYSRHAAIEYQIKGYGITVLYVSYGMIAAAAAVMKLIADQTCRLPAWAQWAGLLLIACLIAHPRSRNAVLSSLQSFSETAGNAGMHIMEASVPLIEEHAKSKNLARKALSQIEDLQSLQNKPPLVKETV